MATESVSTSLVIDAGQVFISIGATELDLPVRQLDTAVRLLEAARLLTAGPGSLSLNAPDDYDDEPADLSALPPAARGRRSRKRVGDALVHWMRQNPGWHSEKDLLSAVVDHKMTDAQPKRALKIALGKQRGEVFDGDDKGHWKLIDDDAGPPPRVRSRASATKATAGRAKSRSGEQGATLGEASKAVNRSKRRLRLKTKPRGGEEAAGKVDAAEQPDAAAADGADEDDVKPTTAGSSTSRVVRVKKGEDRKLAALPPSEREARAEGGAGSSAARQRRWKEIPSEELERARRNLLGLAPNS